MKGWYWIGLVEEFQEPLTPVDLGNEKLMVVNIDGTLTVCRRTCPHRGADLTMGRVCGSAVQCPFHDLYVSIGQKEEFNRFSVREFRSRKLGPSLYIFFEGTDHQPFLDYCEYLEQNYTIVNGFTKKIDGIPFEMIAENAFDELHFKPVHRVLDVDPFTIIETDSTYEVKSQFCLPPSPYQRPKEGEDRVWVGYHAKAFSPGIVFSEISCERPYMTLTSSSNIGQTTRMNISIAINKNDPNKEEGARYLSKGAYAGLIPDIELWKRMDPTANSKLLENEKAVNAYWDFCATFKEEY